MYHIFDRKESKVVSAFKKKKDARVYRDDLNMAHHQVLEPRLIMLDRDKLRYVIVKQTELL